MMLDKSISQALVAMVGTTLNIGIIGLGVVGKALYEGFRESHNLFTHDITKNTSITDVIDNCELAYICVPTPTDDKTHECDSSIVRSVLTELPSGFSAVIKSTVTPGTTQNFHDEFPDLKIACCPEFLRESNANIDFVNQDILVIGTHHRELAETIWGNHIQSGLLNGGKLFHVSPTQAEIAKYAKNTFYSMKVIFGNHFQILCSHFEEDWLAVKEIITAPQSRGIMDSHLEELPGELGFGGTCLPKDTRAIATLLQQIGNDSNLFQGLLQDNENFRGGNNAS
mgnify:FL=1|tara:strand:+ start:3468 stop:4316 length:849 start_codon:yes stop_codon:yes gene_type:complete